MTRQTELATAANRKMAPRDERGAGRARRRGTYERADCRTGAGHLLYKNEQCLRAVPYLDEVD